MEASNRRVGVEVAVAALVGLIPPTLINVLRWGMGDEPRIVSKILWSLVFVANPGSVFAAALVGAAWPHLTGPLTLVANAAIFGGGWFLLRTKPKTSKLRIAALVVASLWLVFGGGLIFFASLFGVP
jgi:hypothetical protein